MQMVSTLCCRQLVRILKCLPIALLVSMPACTTTHPGQAKLVREVVRDTRQNPDRLNALLNGAHKQQAVLDAISRPAESKPWSAYRSIFITDKRINAGVAFYRKHRKLLQRTASHYGVPPEILVSILGVETYYCHKNGAYHVLDALVTLGFYYPPRAKFFRQELKTLLELPSEKRHGSLATLTGSYAGAMGCVQFMPDSIRDYAVDAEHKGHIDLDHSWPDIFSSTANYFAKHGWIHGARIAVKAKSSAHARQLKWQAKPSFTLHQLKIRGYTPLRPAYNHLNMPMSLLTLEGKQGTEYWFTFNNFRTITRYNPSPLYAMAVYQLAQAIGIGAHANAASRTASR